MKKGRNIFEEVNQKTKLKKKVVLNETYGSEMNKTGEICIFLSHKSEDKEYVKLIQSFIHECGIDTYLDEDDEKLQISTTRGDDRKITESIQMGIEHSTHIICFISKKTVKSWWVPYEIGYGDCENKGIATLKIKDIQSSEVPSYLKTHDFLKNRSDLLQYLASISNIKEVNMILNETYNNNNYYSKLYKSFESLKEYID